MATKMCKGLLVFLPLLYLALLDDCQATKEEGHQRQRRQLGGSLNVDTGLLGNFNIGIRFPDTGSRKREIVRDPKLRNMAESSLKFAWDSYRALGIPPGENVFFSPYSIMTALGMLTLGSEGSTEAQLKNVLRVHPSLLMGSGLHEGLNLETSKLQSETSAVFAVGSKFFVDSGSTSNINPDYLNELQKYYNSSMQIVNFGTNPSEARQVINDWVERSTVGKIKNFLPANLDPQTQLILANAIYFKGAWETLFNPRLTRDNSFQPPDLNDPVTVPFMQLTAFFYYAFDEFLGVETLIIPYTDFKYAMHIIVPDRDKDLATLESEIGHLHLTKLDRSTRNSRVVLRMPKFNIKQSLSLRGMLARMNANDVFNPLKNDFSGIFLNSRPGFFVDDVIHEALIEVNEEGTVATAITSIVAVRVSNPDNKIVVLDRPFLFYISDESTGFVLFWGRLANPTKFLG